MQLHTIAPRPGAKHRRKRLGCGESSGHGKTCCKGNKGQKARSGGTIRLGFEGGQMPIFRRLPKKGFNHSDFAIRYAVVNLRDIEERFADGSKVTEQLLRDAGLVKGRNWDGVKILGDGSLSKKFTVSVHKVSASAKEKIEKAGGSVVAVEKPSASA